MKVLILRVTSDKAKGVSKKGNDFNIDMTEVVTARFVDNAKGFGFKDKIYRFGDSTQRAKLESLKSRLPFYAEIQTDIDYNDWDGEIDIITDFKPIDAKVIDKIPLDSKKPNQ